MSQDVESVGMEEGRVVASIAVGPQVDPVDVGNLFRAINRAAEAAGLEGLTLVQDGKVLIDGALSRTKENTEE